MDYTIIKKLRKDHNWTQEQLAGMLWVSRVTYNLLENGKTPRDPYIESFQDIFDVSFSAMENTTKPKINHKLDKNTYEKTKKIILYILSKTSQLPNVGKTVLYKILYFCEFDRYELTGKRLTWLDFVKLPKWPAPAWFDFAIQKMEAQGLLIPVNAKYMWYTQQRYMLNEIVDENFLSLEEKTFVDKVINKIKDMNGTEVSEYSHWDIPWKATPDMELIDIELANHRMYPYSARARKEKLEQDIEMIQNNWAFQFLLDEPDLYEDLV